MPSKYRGSRVKFIPLPLFETDPNEGLTYGVLPVFVFLNPNEELLTVITPSYSYNKVLKSTGFLGLLFYPQPGEHLRFFGEVSENIGRDFLVKYSNSIGLGGKLNWQIYGEYYKDPFERFYGFGPGTGKAAETNFTSNLWGAKGSLAYEFRPMMKWEFEIGWRRLDFLERALDLPDTRQVFTGNSEVVPFRQMIYRLGPVWDTRDHPDFPTQGVYAQGYWVFSHEFLSDNTIYYGYGSVLKQVSTVADRATTVSQLMWEQLYGERIPFYLQNRLGGREKLRAFAEGRFTDRHHILFDVEERVQVYQGRFAGTQVRLSFDPFFSVGQVFSDINQIAWKNLQPVGGIGFRALAIPSIVGRLDLGWGKEGMQAYATLDYPF